MRPVVPLTPYVVMYGARLKDYLVNTLQKSHNVTYIVVIICKGPLCFFVLIFFLYINFTNYIIKLNFSLCECLLNLKLNSLFLQRAPREHIKNYFDLSYVFLLRLG